MICTKRFSTKLNCSSFLTCEFLINYSDAFGGRSAENMFSVMEERLAAAREVYPNISLDSQIFTETCPLLVSIVTPLMKRIHREVSNYMHTRMDTLTWTHSHMQTRMHTHTHTHTHTMLQ